MEGASTVLFQYGLAGVVIFGMSFVIKTLYADNQRLHTQIAQLQETRRQDAKEVVDKVTQPLEGIAQTVSLLNEKITLSKARR